MENETARQWARDSGGTVLQYEQPPKVCAALCALWIRKQAKKESIFFDPKRLYRPDAIDPRSKWEAAVPFEEKVEKLRKAITGRPMGKVEQRYITGGQAGVTAPTINVGGKDFKESLKSGAPKITLAQQLSLAVKENGSGIKKMFQHAMQYGLIADMGYYFRAGNSHAVAFDGSKTDFPAIFFDPMVGQFSFQSQPSFLAWWQRCWDDREADTDTISAWGHIDWRQQVEVDFYRPPKA